MMKQRFKLLLVTTGISISVISGLFHYSNFKRNQKNSFFRALQTNRISDDQILKIPNSFSTIGGFDGKSFYLGNHFEKSALLKFDLLTLDSSKIRIKASDEVQVYEGATMLVNSNRFFLTDGFGAKIMTGSIQNFALEKQIQTIPYNSIVPLSENSFVLRFINQKRNYALGILEDDTVLTKEVLQAQIDGMFCTDGILLKAPNGKIVYVYYYRNQFITTDNKLNVIYRGKTIDTNTIAKIKVSKINSSGDVTLSAPPIYVNRDACADNEHIYIRSALRADNELLKVFDQVTPIDVYRLEDGKYEFSFYLPDFANKKPISFKIYNKVLVVLYDGYLNTFKVKF